MIAVLGVLVSTLAKLGRIRPPFYYSHRRALSELETSIGTEAPTTAAPDEVRPLGGDAEQSKRPSHRTPPPTHTVRLVLSPSPPITTHPFSGLGAQVMMMNGFPIGSKSSKWEVISALMVVRRMSDICDILEAANDEVKADPDVAMWAAKFEGDTISYFDDDVRDNKRVALHALANSHFAIQYVSDRLADDFDIVMAAVKEEGMALEQVDGKWRNQKEIVLAAVGQNGLALKCASKTMRNEKDVVMAAVENYGKAIQYASDKIRRCKDVTIKAVQNDGSAIQYSKFPGAQKDVDVMMEVVKNNGDCLRYGHPDIRSNSDVVIAAIEEDCNAFDHVCGDLVLDRDLLVKAIVRLVAKKSKLFPSQVHDKSEKLKTMSRWLSRARMSSDERMTVKCKVFINVHGISKFNKRMNKQTVSVTL